MAKNNINPVRQKLYKVLYKNRRGQLLSCLEHVRKAGFGLEYKNKGIVRPKFGCIFSFDTINNAKIFMAHHPHQEIWEVEGYGNKHGTIRLGFDSLEPIHMDTMLYFWSKLGRKRGRRLPVRHTPQGCIFSKSVRLIKKVS